MPLQVAVRFGNVSNLPEDEVIHTWAVEGPTSTATAAELDDVCDAFASFYNTIPATFTTPISEYLSPSLSRAASMAAVDLYQHGANTLGGPVPGDPTTYLGSPVLSKAFTLGAFLNGAITSLPSEVALVLSLEAAGHDAAAVEVGTTRPRARHKGRRFIGPLSSWCLEAGQTAEARPKTVFVSLLLTQVGNLRDALEAVNATWDLGVWSRADEEVRPAVAASVDNSFDTQRRRGKAATTRTRVLL